jgi:O-antigen ligase
MIASDTDIFGSRSVATIAILASFLALLLALWPAHTAAALATMVAVAVFSMVAVKSFPTLLFVILFTVLWFPEASQTKDVYTALEAPSVYNYRPIIALYASVFDYLFAAVVLCWATSVLASFRGRRELLKAPLARPMLVFLLLALFSMVYGLFRGGDLYYAMREFRVSAYFVLVYLMAVTTMRSYKLQVRFEHVLLGTAFAIGVYGVIRFALGMGKELGDSRILFYDIGDSIALFIALLFVFSGLLAGRIRGTALTLQALAFTIPLAFTFVFSYRRGAWVAFLAGFVFLLLFSPAESNSGRQMFRRAAVIFIVAVLGGAGLFFLREGALQSVVARFTSISNLSDDASNLFRVYDALNAFYTFLHHPVLGTGYGGRYEFYFYSTVLAPPEFWDNISRTCHNGYLYVLYKMGLVGFTCYLFIFIGFFRRWFRSRSRPFDAFQRTMYGALGASVFAIMENNMTSTMSDSIRPSLVLAFLMAFAAVLFEGNDGLTAQPYTHPGPGNDLQMAPLRRSEASGFPE